MADKLEPYRSKRNFTKTLEPPPGGPDAVARNLVFAVQQHAATRAGLHWDFRLEVDGVLKSWPLRRPPPLDPKQRRGAVMVEDHPYDYRTFEGVIPKGEYGAGQVIVWDEGIYAPDEDGVTSWNDKEEGSRRMLAGIERGKLSFTLAGQKLKGSFALIKTKYAPDSWLLIKHRDEYASERDLLAEDASIRSGLTLRDLKEGRLPSPRSSVTLRGVGLTTVAPPLGAKEAPFPDPPKERPMLATLVDRPLDAPNWLWEPKLDGVRALAFIRSEADANATAGKGQTTRSATDGRGEDKNGEGKRVELRSRRGVDITRAYPLLTEALKTQPARSLVLDGEICALDDQGVPRFQLLQPRINLTRAADVAKVEAEIPVVYFVFDILYLDGHDLRGVPLRERKALLEATLATGAQLRRVTYVAGDGRSMAASARDLGFEGVVGKRTDSRYEPGARSRAWLKVKTVQEQEFVIGGYTRGAGARGKSFGALAIGYYEDGKLRHAGNVGSGFNDALLATLFKRLRALETDRSPFGDKVEADVTFVQPRLVAAVKFSEWTQDGRLRAPVFLGLRDDVAPSQVQRETAAAVDSLVATAAAAATTSAADDLRRVVDQALRELENPKSSFTLAVAGAAVNLSNLNKEFWPAYGERQPLTKRDLVRYYVELAPTLLPHLKDRPLTLTRYPNGVAGALFYQKHYGQPIPEFVDTVRIWSSSNEGDGEYILCNNLPTLVWLAQIADLELHAWMSRVDPAGDAHGRPLTFAGSEPALDESILNFPDYIVFDLDPYIYSGHEKKGEEPEFNSRGWEKTVTVALALKDLLDQLRLSSYVKTSGKTGVHVYVPILRHYDYDAVRAATETLGRFLLRQLPKDVTMEWDTSKRAGKVFFDHNQNTRGKTLAAQYSLRPTPWAGVSTPLAWSELPQVDPTALNLTTVPRRVASLGDLWADILDRKNDLGALIAAGREEAPA